MLIPLHGTPRRRRFKAYDLEWVPQRMTLRLCGVFDGERYSAYLTVEEFLRSELTPHNAGMTYFAHAGGLADIQFLLPFLSSAGYRVNAAFSGSSAVIVRVSDGHYHWTFADSLWLMRAPLKDIAEWLGEEKLFAEARKDESWYGTVSLSLLLQYNEQDCRILWRAIHELESQLLSLGGSLRLTLASCAMDLFRRRYLHREISTSPMLNLLARHSYTASRVEVFRKGRVERVNYYDINSSFPFAMRQPLPGSVQSWSRKVPAHNEPCLVRARVQTADAHIPPLPRKGDNRVFFPVGEWEGWFTGADLELLERSGGRLVQVKECYTFEQFGDMGDFCRDLYERRQASAAPFHRTIYKLLMNSLYGKTAERPNKISLAINPPKIDREHWDLLMPGHWLVPTVRYVPHEHVILASYVVAIARARLDSFLQSCSEVYYTDTDGFATPDELETSDELGALKCEARNEPAEFVSPKIYRLGEKIRAKGFHRLNPKEFAQLIEGKPVVQRRMLRVRELARKGRSEPEEILQPKQLRGIVEKRFVYPDGETRPWTVAELEKLFP